MILILTQQTSPRLTYIFGLIFGDLLQLEHRVTSDAEEFRNYDGPKLAYGDSPPGDSPFFKAAGLLSETGIRKQVPDFFTYQGTTAFYSVTGEHAALPFDPFASAFYLVSRYEEYLPFHADVHGRFPAGHSTAFCQGFLQKPLVNIWSQMIGKILQERYPALKLPPKHFQFQPTIDVDSAYAYRQKGWLRTAGACMRDLLHRDFAEISARTRVLTGLQKDPFDTFDDIRNIHLQYNLTPVFFMLMGDHGKYDKNIPVSNAEFRSLTQSLAAGAEMGIHPSYKSYGSPAILRKEIARLSAVIGQPVTKSRQHFLRMTLPGTYRNLISQGITDDYSMGYASETGFRASICDTFRFYDLENETTTKLNIHPFAVMDGTLKDYKNLSPDEALVSIKQLMDEVRQVNGTFISLWHNESLSDTKRWSEWRKVYEGMLQSAFDFVEILN
jgi:hypothetical protein